MNIKIKGFGQNEERMMMMKMKKARRWIARILVFVMILTSGPMYPKKEAKAAGGVYSKLIS